MDRLQLLYMARPGYRPCLGCRKEFLSYDVTRNRICRGYTSRNAGVGGRTCRLERMPQPREAGFTLARGKR